MSFSLLRQYSRDTLKGCMLLLRLCFNSNVEAAAAVLGQLHLFHLLLHATPAENLLMQFRQSAANL